MTTNTTTATSLFIAGQWVAPEDSGSLEIALPLCKRHCLLEQRTSLLR
jgi:hypothetical protein